MRRLALVLLIAACGPQEARPPGVTGLEGLMMTDIQPRTWLPGTHVVLTGHAFVDPTLGTARLRLTGSVDGTALDVEVPVRYVDAQHLDFEAQPATFGNFTGQAILTFDSLVDGQPHAAPVVDSQLVIASELTPSLASLASEPLFVNDPTLVTGDGFLLGSHEGETRAVVSGCFTPATGGGCQTVAETEITAQPKVPFDRTQAVFPYATAISGIQPGTFTGTLKLRNVHPTGVIRESSQRNVSWHIGRPMVSDASPGSASLGQFVFFHGGGFVGGSADELTLLRIDGTFQPENGGATMPVSITVVPDFVDGQTARYVLDSTDALGQLVDLRMGAGRLDVTVTPTVRKGSDALDGDPATIHLVLAHVKQVVWVKFLDSYVDSLRVFGLRGVDDRIRERIFEIAKRDYQGVNIEFRADEPTDFALYSIVEIGGPDPNALGLLGYDNTPGKDVGNMRLYDHIGGINAVTQEDGSPGYGGIFAEEFLGFSQHPAGVKQLPVTSALFDRLFDPFRPDQGGLEVTAADLQSGGIVRVRDGSLCPAADRPTQLGCAIFVLGNLIGTTLTHEVGHSLGLANPYSDGYHDAGDLPNRLMDAGGARPFEERAELQGQGPAVFCDDEYDYLRNTILKGSSEQPPAVTRPACN
jgi:hypothetical protein